jgi:hypothetical protein
MSTQGLLGSVTDPLQHTTQFGYTSPRSDVDDEPARLRLAVVHRHRRAGLIANGSFP